MKKNNGGLSHSMQELYVIHLGKQYLILLSKCEKLLVTCSSSILMLKAFNSAWSFSRGITWKTR